VVKKALPLLLDMRLELGNASNVRDVFEPIVAEGTAVVTATLGARVIHLRWQ
jgi:hypothetical protein